MIASPFLPWVTVSVDGGVEQASLAAGQTGFETPVSVWLAIVAGGAGLIAAGVMAAGRVASGARLGMVAAALGALTAWRGYRYAQEPDSLVVLRDEVPITQQVGNGIWLLAAGVVLLLVASIVSAFRAREGS